MDGFGDGQVKSLLFADVKVAKSTCGTNVVLVRDGDDAVTG
jgi:hypothetical protein